MFRFAFAEIYLTNDDLARNLLKIVSEKLVQEIEQEIGTFSPKTLSLTIQNGKTDAGYLKIFLYDDLLSNDFEIYEGEEKQSALNLAVTIETVEINYEKIWRKYWFGSKQVRRKAVANCSYILKNSQGKIVAAGEVANELSDEIPLSVLERQEIRARHPKLESEKSNWTEPVLVSAIIGALIYAFYAADTD
jgi:hypothetical protein